MSARFKASAMACALLGAALLVDGFWIQGKAVLAQWLIARAWQQTLATGKPVPPWRWADTWPVARLRFDRGGTNLFVLEGANGGALAFGPGHMVNTAMPGEPGTSVVAGHRDTHFRVLSTLAAGDRFSVQTRDGKWQHYKVDSFDIVDTRQHPVWAISPARDEIQLVTCYPFDAIVPGGPLRYIVTAVRIGADPSTL